MSKGRVDADALRALLARQMDDVAAEALERDGQVATERLEALGRLSRLVEMRAAGTTSRRRRWGVLSVALATLAGASVLLFARVSSTEVEIDLKVSEFSFVLPTVQVITDEMRVSELGISGLSGVELPAARPGRGKTQGASDVFVAAVQLGPRAGTVTLAPITAPAGARVFLSKADGEHRYQLVLRGALSRLAVSVQGPTRIVVPPAVNEVHDFAFPRRIALEPDSQQVSLDFAAGEVAQAPRPLRSPLPAEGLFLFRVDQFQEADRTLVRQVPTIRSGTLYFEAIDGRARQLRVGEGLRFASSHGEIRELQLGDDGLAVRFHGTVRGMSAGSGDVQRSLMPTLLEWLRARHGLSLLWGTTAYVVGAVMTVLGWRRRAA